MTLFDRGAPPPPSAGRRPYGRAACIMLLGLLSTPALAQAPSPPAPDPVEMYAQRERDRSMQVWGRQQTGWPAAPRFNQETLQRQMQDTWRWSTQPIPDHPWGPHCPPAPYCRPPDYVPQPPYTTCPPMWCP